jgi:predicted ATPase/class 3 adenylate cyclase
MIDRAFPRRKCRIACERLSPRPSTRHPAAAKIAGRMGLPTGPAVTFLFTDIEGSTRLERSVGSASWAEIVARHDQLLREAIESNGGAVVKTEGDAFFAAFDDPAAATRAAVAAQRAVSDSSWPEGCLLRVRMGLHTGEGRLRAGRAQGDPEDYVGIDVNYAARIAAAGNGGQVVLSQALVDALGSDAERGDGTNVTDEGLRAVKDFEEPQRLHRLVIPGAADDDRPLRTLTAPSNLPADVTELVGRAADLARLRGELDQTRVLTLTGPGGSGKTRLALGLGRAVLDRFPHGVWFVDLAGLTQPHLVETTIAAALSVRESAEKPIGDVLHEHLRERTMLLLLDNLEQLLPPAAQAVALLVRVAPKLCVIVTSRELLRIAGERGYNVPPLDVAAGMELFESRARAIRPDLDFTDDNRIAVRTICERLGGVPLAIELAAARVRLMSPALILERLVDSLSLAGSSRDVPERQRTLRGAIDWSHELLDEPERRLFRRLAVFAGGWTAEEAIRVADIEGDLGVDVVEGLESLADKSLIRIEPADSGGETRFDFHPLLREYALERLEASGEAEMLLERHALAMVDVLESIGARILGRTGTDAIRLLDAEIYNLRAACDFGLQRDIDDIPLRILAATWRWFQQRGFLREARGVLQPLLAHEGIEPEVRIGALAAEGGLAYWMNDFEACRVAYRERLALAEATGDRVLIGDAHYDLGFLGVIARDPRAVLEHEQLALEIFESTGNDAKAMWARQALGLANFLVGEYAEALAMETKNQVEFREKGSPYQVADSMTFLSGVNFRLGEPEVSWRWMLDALDFFAEHDNASGIARALGMAAILLVHFSDAELGARVAGATFALSEEKGVMVAPVTVLHLPDPRETAAQRLGKERARELLEDGAMTPLEQVIEEVQSAPLPKRRRAPSAG